MVLSESSRQWVAALGRIPSGIFVLTASRGDAETGMLTSWVQQCSFDPPQLTIAIRKGRFLADWMSDGLTFTLNILDDGQSDMIGHFGRGFEPGEPAFEGLEIERRPNAGPILSESLAYLDCRAVNRFDAGDHDAFVCHIVGGVILNDGRPMVHVRKSGLHY